MPTTTKMGIVYPASTDLVKDGATAMGTISTTVDAKSGLVLLATASFTTSSAVSLATNTFTSNFDHYKIFFTVDSLSASGALYLRLRAAGSDDSTSNYSYAGAGVVSTTAAADNTGSGGVTSVFELGYSDTATGTDYGLEINVYNPKRAVRTRYHALSAKNVSATSNSLRVYGGVFNATTSFDSATIYHSSGTLTGNYSVFGVNK
jgi:hypothetical protein